MPKQETPVSTYPLSLILPADGMIYERIAQNAEDEKVLRSRGYKTALEHWPN